MKLKELINKHFFGLHIEKKDLKENGDIYYLSKIDNLSEDGIVLSEKIKKVKSTKVQSKYSLKVVGHLEYGDYLIYSINNNWIVNRYKNELNGKTLISDDVLIIRPTGSYLDSFLKDSDGRLYFENKIKKFGKEHKDFNEGFITSVLNLEVDLSKKLIVKKAFEESKLNKDKLDIKRQPLDPRKIRITTDALPIYSVLKRVERGSIDLFTEFQRLQNLWDINAKSRLIESILVRFPIPSFYFDCSNEDKWLVIDGLQRLSTLHQFYTDRFELQNLEYLRDLEGKKFSELDNSYQSRIEETNITALKILPGTPLRVKYSLFERINTEGKPLKAQELRHAINSFGDGKPSKYIKELSDLEIFKKVWGDRPKSRMQDREAILRHLAFKISGYEEYKPEMKTFLDENMAKIYEISTTELEEIKENFADSLVLSTQLFPESPFRIKSSDNKNIFNLPLFDSFTVLFSDLSNNERDRIIMKKEMGQGMLHDLIVSEEFSTWLSNENSNSKEGVVKRFKAIKALISLILER